MSQTITTPQSKPAIGPATEPEDDEERPASDAPVLDADMLRPGTNLTDELPDDYLERLGADCKRRIEIDESSRSEWLKTSEKALDLAMQVSQEKSYPHDKASNVIYPMITIAALQFAQRCYAAVVPGDRVVNCVVVGDDTGKYEIQTDPETGQPVRPEVGEGGEINKAPMTVRPGAKAARAERVSKHMSWQCLQAIPEWEPTIDQGLHYLPIAGCMFRRMYYFEDERRPAVTWYPADKFIINNKSVSIETAPRYTVVDDTVYPFQITERQMTGEWRECDIESFRAGENADQNDDQAPRKFFEHFCRLDLDGSGYPKPFIVTLHENGKVVRIEANWEKVNKNGTVSPIVEFVKYTFFPNPKGGFYDVGFGWLLCNINETVNSAINQLFDAGHWQNAPTGFIGRGLRLGRAGEVTMKPNSFKQVDASGEELAKNIWVYQHPGPSQTMFQLLGLLLEASQGISSVQDIMQGRMDQNIAPTTAMTLVEQGMTMFTSIFKRVHRSAKKEFGLLYKINSETLPQHMYKYGDVLDDQEAIAQDDYNVEDQDVRPVTDPKMVSDQVKQARAAFLMSLADKGLVRREETTKRMLAAYNIDDVDELLPDPNAKDPMQELAVRQLQAQLKKTEMDIENERLDRVMAADKTRAQILEIRANAVKKIAEAEAVEEGAQLPQYQAFIDDLDAALALLPPPQQLLEAPPQQQPPGMPPGAPPPGMAP